MTRISARKIRISKNKAFTENSGFSLIEILIVVGLIAMIMAIAIPNFGMALKINLNNSNRELATTIRSAHDEAVLKGQVYRLAFDVDRNQYWVEVGEAGYLMLNDEQAEEQRRRIERLSREEREKIKDPFQLAQAVTKKKLKLPSGVKFAEIQTAHNKDPIKAGMAYAYVFPHGFIEKLIVHLKDGFDRESTLAVNSVTGKSRLYDHYVKETE